MAFIELNNVKKIFHAGDEEYAALKGVSLGIESGEFVAIMGPSGSGKSTLLSLVGGLSKASSGVVAIDGIDLGALGPNKLSDFRREYLGFVFQSFYLVPYLTAIENVLLPLTIQPGLNGTDRAKALEALSRVGLEAKANRLPSQLSGGEQERVAIARALVNRPALILADEPTGNLDTKTGDKVLELLEGLHKDGHTIVMVTHSEENAKRASGQNHRDQGRGIGAIIQTHLNSLLICHFCPLPEGRGTGGQRNFYRRVSEMYRGRPNDLTRC